ncbi:MAG: serine--tRNA ligase [Deltaproteobacteria bacterium]|nr:serine--tRNA ligase [Deltaproteobacteria bacterium]
MIDYGFIEKNRDRIMQSLQKRGDAFDLQEIDHLNQKRKDLQRKHDDEKAKLNDLSKQIGQIYQEKKEPDLAEELKKQTTALKVEIQALHEAMEKAQSELKEKLLFMPNVLDPSVEVGKDESDNLEIRTWGNPVTIKDAKMHDDLMVALGMLDIERSAKVSGSRFSYLVGWGARLERALVNFMLDVHRLHGYTEISSPLLVHQDAMTGTGQLPKFKEDAFHMQDPEFYLIPTAEVPVTNYYREETLRQDMLPQKFVCYSPCFRKEAGSYGKDTKGLIRQHQFHKVELVQFTTPENSSQALEELTSHAETILQKLALPYRVVSLCSGDIGFGAAKTYDIEVWLAGQQAYREISSCSCFEDFQARRAGIKYKKDGKNDYVHTLNGSGLAIGRTLVAIVENYQQPDGSLRIPDVLVPYVGTEMICKEG